MSAVPSHVHTPAATLPSRAYGFRSALADALSGAAQWRVLLLWLLVLVALACFGIGPLSSALSSVLDQHPDAAAMAHGATVSQIGDLITMVSKSNGGEIAAGFKSAIVMALLLSPWLTGLASHSIHAGKKPGLASLFTGAFREYPRQLGLSLWSLLPLAIGFAVFGGLSHWAEQHAETATLETSANFVSKLALIAGGITLLLAHASIEAARGFFAVRPDTANPVKAWWRGVKLLLRRPLHTLGLYVLASLPGLLVAFLLLLVRVRIDAVGWGMWLAAFLIVQLGIAALAWSRVARLRALATLANDEMVQRRYR